VATEYLRTIALVADSGWALSPLIFDVEVVVAGAVDAAGVAAVVAVAAADCEHEIHRDFDDEETFWGYLEDWKRELCDGMKASVPYLRNLSLHTRANFVKIRLPGTR